MPGESAVFHFDASEAFIAAAELAGIGVRVSTQAPALVRHYGQLYQTRVKAGASGRPGPRAVTGEYRRSISLQLGMVDGAFSATVGTDHPAGRRLEYGFVGTDSLGRHYSQSPMPHFEPSLGRTMDEMSEAMAALVSWV